MGIGSGSGSSDVSSNLCSVDGGGGERGGGGGGEGGGGEGVGGGVGEADGGGDGGGGGGGKGGLGGPDRLGHTSSPSSLHLPPSCLHHPYLPVPSALWAYALLQAAASSLYVLHHTFSPPSHVAPQSSSIPCLHAHGGGGAGGGGGEGEGGGGVGGGGGNGGGGDGFAEGGGGDGGDGGGGGGKGGLGPEGHTSSPTSLHLPPSCSHHP